LKNQVNKGFCQFVCAFCRDTYTHRKNFTPGQNNPLKPNGGFMKMYTLKTVLSFPLFMVFFLGIGGTCAFAQESETSKDSAAFSDVGPSLKELGEAQRDIDRYEEAQDNFNENVDRFMNDRMRYNEARAKFDRARSLYEQEEHQFNKTYEKFSRERDRYLEARDKFVGARERFQDARSNFFGSSINASSPSSAGRMEDRPDGR
jgi:tetratricopeptide (TPR) repeat protein